MNISEQRPLTSVNIPNRSRRTPETYGRFISYLVMSPPDLEDRLMSSSKFDNRLDDMDRNACMKGPSSVVGFLGGREGS